MDVSEKKICRKTVAQDVFWQIMKSWCSKDNDQNISARSLTLLCWVGIVWSTTTRTWVSDATAVTFSIKCFNPLKLYPLSENMFRQWFVSFKLVSFSKCYARRYKWLFFLNTVHIPKIANFGDFGSCKPDF